MAQYANLVKHFAFNAPEEWKTSHELARRFKQLVLDIIDAAQDNKYDVGDTIVAIRHLMAAKSLLLETTVQMDKNDGGQQASTEYTAGVTVPRVSLDLDRSFPVQGKPPALLPLAIKFRELAETINAMGFFALPDIASAIIDVKKAKNLLLSTAFISSQVTAA